ncbi:MAG: NUDIX hydrolase [Cyclobacteriaceae bacterium]
MNEFASLAVSDQSYECTITVDCAVFGFQDNQLRLLCVNRGVEPFKNMWQLPGGIMNADESLDEAANRVLYSLTDIKDIKHVQVGAYSHVDRHPIKRVVTVCFYALIKPENHPIIAKKYVSDINWFAINEIPNMAFDHNQLASDTHDKLRENLKDKLIFGEMLPAEFTLKELQDLYESILEQQLDRRNFRKSILQKGLIESTGKKKIGVKGGPELFRMKKNLA